MAGEKHLLLTIGGGYTDADLLNEKWQTTLRLALFSGPSGDSAPDIGTLPNNWEPVSDSISRIETSWTITGNWNIDLGAGASFHPDDWLNDQVAPALTAWFNQSTHSNQGRVETVKVYPIGPDGKAYPAPPYALGSPCTLTYTGSFPTGSGASGIAPLQIAVVASHRTAQIGRKGRGRMFLPNISSTILGTDSLIGTTPRNLARDKQITLLESLSYLDAVTEWYLIPAIIGSPWTQYSRINAVQVGNVPDTQRRRRNGLVEVLSQGTVDPPT